VLVGIEWVARNRSVKEWSSREGNAKAKACWRVLSERRGAPAVLLERDFVRRGGKRFISTLIYNSSYPCIPSDLRRLIPSEYHLQYGGKERLKSLFPAIATILVVRVRGSVVAFERRLRVASRRQCGNQRVR